MPSMPIPRAARILRGPLLFNTGGCRAVLRLFTVMTVLSLLLASFVDAQSEKKAAGLKGVIRDSHGQPIRDVPVYLESTTGVYARDHMMDPLQPPTSNDSARLSTRTDSQGNYSFTSLPEGTYSLHVNSAGTGQAEAGPFTLALRELKVVDLTLVPTAPADAMPGFYDEPQFTVAGVTQTGNAGGHGSDTVQRNSEALAKATASLTKPMHAQSSESMTGADLERRRSEIRARLVREDMAELHHSLADVEEGLSNPLEAVREYQRAAEMEPSEPYLFDWGAELLAHRAPGPAVEVFAKGHRLFPRSARMLLGLGVAQYARGAYDAALQALFQASDLEPSDSTPYLFLGKMQGVETAELHGFVDKFARFAALQPDNALANYYYAVSLRRESKTTQAEGETRRATAAKVHELLAKSIRLDPTLSLAYLELGAIDAEAGNLAQAINDYEKARDIDTTSVEAHYRLALAYRRTGRKKEAEQEAQIYQKLSKQSDAQAERERREVQQFVFTMREKAAPPNP